MKSNRQSSIWPYLGILLCLFVLSLAATRTWQQLGGPENEFVEWEDDNELLADESSAAGNEAIADEPVAKAPQTVADEQISSTAPVVAEEYESSVVESHEGIDDSAAHQTEIASTGENLTLPDTSALDATAPEIAPTNVGDASGPDEASTVTTEPAGEAAQVIVSDTAEVRVTDSNDRLAMIPRRGARPDMRTPHDAPDHESPAPAAPQADAWSGPRQLLSLVDELAAEEATAKWAFDTAHQLRQLDSMETLTGGEGATILEHLHDQSDAAGELASGISSQKLRSQLMHARYALNRRLEVWEAARVESAAPASSEQATTGSAMADQLREVAALTRGHAQGEAWRKFLLIDSLRRVADKSEVATENEKRELARRVLARLSSARLSRQQRQFVSEGAVAALDASLRRWAAEPVDRRELLANIEAYEEHGLPSTARLVAHQFQTLSFSPEEADRELAQQASRHYRNANIRVVVSNQLMNRCLPAQRPVDEEVNDQILGAQVEGYSRTITRLALRLIPDPSRIRLSLEASGHVSSDTSSASGPAIFHNAGRTSFAAHKEIHATQDGLNLFPATANASSRSDLTGLDTDFDHVPLVRSLVRSIARSEHDKSHGQAMSEVEQRVAEAASARLDAEVAKQAAAAQNRFTKQFLTPLKRLSLDPAPLEMSSTAERMVMRFRLASDQQLGAHSARPQAPAESLASVQVHESALNNVLEQLDLNGRTFELPELYHALAQKFDRKAVIPDDLPEDVTVTFAPENSLQVRCSDGKLELVISIAELRQPRNRYRNLKVRAFYRPEAAGMKAELVRDGVILLEGKSLSTGDQIVLRGVFAKVLSQSRRPQLINSELAGDRRMKGLAVSQLVIDDGWLGLALSPEARVVRKPTVQQRFK